MRRFLRLVVLVFGISATPALALDPCGNAVVDTAGVLRAIPAIETVIADIERRTSAVVRVRFAPDHAPQPNLDRHVEHIADAVCQSWNGATGGRRGNMVILWVTMNRQVGLYYGDQWSTILGQQWPTILANQIRPALRDGDYDRAVVQGLTRIGEVIVATNTPTPPTRERVVERVQERVIEREPMDLKPIVPVLGFFVLLIALLLGGQKGYSLWVAYETRKGERDAAQLKAIEAFRAVGGLTQQVDRVVREVRSKLTSLSASISTAQRHEWEAKLRTFDVTIANMAAMYNAAIDPHTDDLTVEEYRASLATVTELQTSYQGILGAVSGLREEIAATEALAASLPERLASTNQLLTTVRDGVSAIVDEGFKVSDLEAELATCERSLAQVRQQIEQRDWKGANATLDTVEDKAARIRNEVRELPLRKQSLTERLRQLKSDVATFDLHKSAARVAMDTMVSTFTQKCYSIVAGNGTEAERQFEALNQKLTVVATAITNQHWDGAESELQDVARQWSTITSLLEAILHRKAHLEQMVHDAEAEYAEAIRSIDATDRYLRSHAEHATAEKTRALAALRQSLNQASTLKQQTPLPVVELFRLVTDIDDKADALMTTATAAVAEVTARKERAERLKRDIASRINDYKLYQTNHNKDIPENTKESLSLLELNLWRLQKERDIATVLRLGAELEQALDAVDKASKSSVRSAEARRSEKRRQKAEDDRREAEERRRRDSDSSFGGGSSSWSGSSSSSSSGSGGGSSSWGSSSGSFGGGSSDW